MAASYTFLLLTRRLDGKILNVHPAYVNIQSWLFTGTARSCSKERHPQHEPPRVTLNIVKCDMDESLSGSSEMDAEQLNISDTHPQTDTEVTIREMTRAIEQDSSDAQAYFKRGNAFSNMGDYDRAIEDLSKTIELRPSDSMAFNNRGMAHLCIGEFTEAIVDLSRSIEIDPGYRDAYHNRGLAYSELESLDEAIADITRAIEIDPAFWSAYRHRGIFFWMKGDSKASYDDFLTSKELQNTDQ